MATKKRAKVAGGGHIIGRVWKEIRAGNLSVLDENFLPEEELKDIAEKIKKTAFFVAVFHLIDDLPRHGRAYDWNVGSILQHLDIELVTSSLQQIKDMAPLYESMGLAWVLGEYRSRNPFVIDYLQAVVRQAKDSNAWWRAAYSLERLGVDDAVNLLKRSLKPFGLKSLGYYLDHIDDKRSLIGILVISNVDNIQNVVYPRIRRTFLGTDDPETIINCCWLIGRLKLIDGEIMDKLVRLMRHKNYDLKYYTFFALQNNATEHLRPILEKALSEKDPLIRKMATRGLMSIGSEKSLGLLESALISEKEQAVISEISRTIYQLKNPTSRERLLIELKSYKNENGMIADEGDTWYGDPATYHIFCEAEDPENICFNLILQKIGSKRVVNPIDIATGTGRLLWQVLEKVRFAGTAYGIDSSAGMCDFTLRNLRRERKYTQQVQIVKSTIREAPRKLKVKSNFIVSALGFPSRILDKKNCIEELKSIHELLTDDGEFFTIGWDETFNDELSTMWFKYVPDDILAWDFEEWRRKRASAIVTPRNCGLTWFKKGLAVPLQFGSLKETAQVMGYLFGRDAAQYVMRTGKTEWEMSIGITRNTKKELARIIKTHEKGS